MDVKLNLLIREDYFERFYQIKGGELTDRAAWDCLEAEFFERYGLCKFSTFGSFKTSKYRYLRRLQENRVSKKGQQCCTKMRKD